MAENTKRLYRSRTNRVIAGVCGGLGVYFNVDPVIFRILFVILLFTPPGVGLLLYIIMIFVIPLEPGDKEMSQKEEIKQIAKDVKDKAQSVASEFKGKKNWSEEPKNWLGIILVILGIIFLFGQIFSLSFFKWAFIWPAIIVLIGLYLLARSANKK